MTTNPNEEFLESSPAACILSKSDITFKDGEKIYTHIKDSLELEDKRYTFSCINLLPLNFIVHIKVKKITVKGFLCIGVSENVLI